MIYNDLFLCLQKVAFDLIQKQPEECLANLPCACGHPGKHLQCEDCPYLEACLSRLKLRTAESHPIKLG